MILKQLQQRDQEKQRWWLWHQDQEEQRRLWRWRVPEQQQWWRYWRDQEEQRRCPQQQVMMLVRATGISMHGQEEVVSTALMEPLLFPLPHTLPSLHGCSESQPCTPLGDKEESTPAKELCTSLQAIKVPLPASFVRVAPESLLLVRILWAGSRDRWQAPGPPAVPRAPVYHFFPPFHALLSHPSSKLMPNVRC